MESIVPSAIREYTKLLETPKAEQKVLRLYARGILGMSACFNETTPVLRGLYTLQFEQLSKILNNHKYYTINQYMIHKIYT